MKMRDRPDLETLSPKKRIAMDCFFEAVDNVEDISHDLKRDWTTWIFYTQKFLSDDQTDQFIKALKDTITDYEMVFFVNEFNEIQKNKLIQRYQVAPEIKLTTDLGGFRM